MTQIKTRVQRPLVLLALAVGAGCHKEEPPPPPPPEVKVATVLERDVPVYVEAIGQTRGSTEIEIRARVDGFIQTIDFQEGSPVKKGQRLYTIDSQPFQATLAQTRGDLAEAEAQLARAHQDVVRYEPLVAKNAISRQEYETAVAVERAAEASVAAAKAVVQRAEIDLGYTRVLAPDDGLVGKTEVYPGSLVGRGSSTLLTHISKIETIHVRFAIPERDYLHYSRRRGERAQTGTAPDLPFELVLADGTVHPHPGKLVFVDRNVDPQTGTILLEAAFPNPEKILRPGQYARVRAAVDLKKGAILVPQRAVQEVQGIYSVAVVAADGGTDLRQVKPAERLGALWVIDQGLKPGEKVVVDGLQKIRPGVKVNAQVVAIDEGGGAGNGAGSKAPAPAGAPAPTASGAEAKGAAGN